MTKQNPKARLVTIRHYKTAIRQAVQKAFRSELGKYKTKIEVLNEVEKEFIKELVWTLKHFGVAYRVRLMNSLARRHVMTETEFNSILVKLEQDPEMKLIHVSRNRVDVRFIDPLLAPFLSSVIYRKELLSKEKKPQPSLFEPEDDLGGSEIDEENI